MIDEKIRESKLPIGFIAESLGVPEMTLYRYRIGRHVPPDEFLERLATFLTARGTPCTADELKDPTRVYRGPGQPRKNPEMHEPTPLVAVGAPPIELTDRGALYEVPVYGYVAAGPAVDETLEEIDTMTVVEADAKFRFLRVRGRSMIERGVDDGDDLKVEERPARDGEVVLADLDGRLMLATIRFKNRKVWKLEKAAPGYRDILIRKGQTLTVRWVVLEIIKRQRPLPTPKSS